MHLRDEIKGLISHPSGFHGEEKSVGKLLVCWQSLPFLSFAKGSYVQPEHIMAIGADLLLGGIMTQMSLEMTGLFCSCWCSLSGSFEMALEIGVCSLFSLSQGGS